MPRTLTAWVRPTVDRKVPFDASIQMAIWARSVGVKVKMIARSSAAWLSVAAIKTTPAINKLGARHIRERIIARKSALPGRTSKGPRASGLGPREEVLGEPSDSPRPEARGPRPQSGHQDRGTDWAAAPTGPRKRRARTRAVSLFRSASAAGGEAR